MASSDRGGLSSSDSGSAGRRGRQRDFLIAYHVTNGAVLESAVVGEKRSENSLEGALASVDGKGEGGGA